METKAWLTICVLASVLLTSIGGGAQEDGPLQPGDVLDQRNWQKAEGLLPPEILAHYQKGEYANPIIAWPDGLQHWDEDFTAGTEANRGKFALDEQGTIIDEHTGQQPSYVVGYYLFGRIELFIEKETFDGVWNRKFDWKGGLVGVFVNGRGINNSPDGKTYLDASPVAVMFAENVRMHRATMAGPPPGKNSPFVTYREHFNPSLFEYQELTRVGK